MTGETKRELDVFLKVSHDLALWMIQLADTKADILMAASVILAGLLVPEALHATGWATRGVLVLAIGLAIASSTMALAAVFPRTTPKDHSSLLYFVEVGKFRSGADYLARIYGLESKELDRELAQQIWELARTQKRKYMWLRTCVPVFVTCLAFAIFGVLLALIA